MPRIAYVNGAYRPLREAGVHIEDRGFQFADGIYEVALFVSGRFWDLEGHLARWNRSLRELEMTAPMSDRAMTIVMRRLIRANRLGDALVYCQATRGTSPRNHAFPPEGTPPSLVMTARPFALSKYEAQAARGVSVISAPDIRWGRVDIKTVGLLPNALAKEAARRKGAVEAWLVKDGAVTEGSSTNAWIVSADGVLITHPVGNAILGGVTRATLMRCARDMQMKVIERPFTLEEAFAASEAFISSATTLATSVTSIDGRKIGAGAPGPVVRRLREAYIEYARRAG